MAQLKKTLKMGPKDVTSFLERDMFLSVILSMFLMKLEIIVLFMQIKYQKN